MGRALHLAPVLLVALLGVAAGGGDAAHWRSDPAMPEPRSEVAAAKVGGDLVVAGGFVADGHDSARVDAYSPADERWRRLPDLPVPVDHAAGASVNGRMYVIGGYGSDRMPLRTVFRFDGGRWHAIEQLPDARAAAAAAVAGGRLYVVGGRDGRRALAKDAFVLAPGTGRWTRIRGPHPREHLAAVASRGRVYAIGGRAAGIDTNTRRWSRLPDLPTPRHGLGVVAAQGRIWALAGGPVPGLSVSGAVESLKALPVS